MLYVLKSLILVYVVTHLIHEKREAFRKIVNLIVRENLIVIIGFPFKF